MTLQQAIKEAFYHQKTDVLSIGEIKNIIVAQKWYADHTVTTDHIRSRIKMHPHLFRLQGNQVKLLATSGMKLEDMHFKLLDILRSHGGQYNVILLLLLYFYQRVVSNPERYNKFLPPVKDQDNPSQKFLTFIRHLPECNDQFHNKFTDTEALWARMMHSVEAQKIIEHLEKIDFSAHAIPDQTFNAFLNGKAGYPDRGSDRGMYHLPTKVIEMINPWIEGHDFRNMYIPYAGACHIPALIDKKKSLQENFYGSESNPTAYMAGLINLVLNDYDTSNFILQDSLLMLGETREFDLIICNPPFGQIWNDANLVKSYRFIKSNKVENILIQLIIQQLSKEGKAIIIVPDGVLYSVTKGDVELRKHLVKNHLLEKVISLPAGIYHPFSQIKTSILVLSKTPKQGIEFVNGDDPEEVQHQSNDPDKQFMVSEPESTYGKNRKVSIAAEQIDSNKYNLVANRYLEAQQLPEGENMIQLKDVCLAYTNLKHSANEEYPYVNIKDLNKLYYNLWLDTEQLEKNSAARKGKLLQQNALLVGSIAGSLKPTLAGTGQTPCIISPNIHILKIDEQQVLPDYLIFELANPYIEQQVKAFSYGATTLKRIRLKDLLSIRIYIPPMDEQKKILEKKKEALLSARLEDLNELAGNLGINKQLELELLGFVRHELGNIMGGLRNHFINLERVLEKLDIDFSTKVSSREKAPSIKDTFLQITSNIKDVEQLTTNIKSIIDLGSNGLTPERREFKDFIHTEVENSDVFKYFNVHYFYNNQQIRNKDPYFWVDPRQFKVVIKNFIQNSIAHGVKQKDRKGNIVFNLNEDDDFYYISLINDGPPFPEDFSLEDFLGFGKRFKSAKGSGLGGYLMGKIVDNHEGEIQLMQAGTAFFLDGNDGDTVFLEPTSFIKVGVHFLITLPKSDQV